MEIKVGEYVRTIHGEIAIFRGWNNNLKSQWSCKLEFQKIKTLKYCSEEYIAKHSTNIIDLIEVGDYVNGYKVIDIIKGFKVIIDKLELDTTTGTYKNIGIKDIKSILAHENFEDMEYKVC